MLEDGLYAEPHIDEYFICQKVAGGELIMVGLLTLEQLDSQYPGERVLIRPSGSDVQPYIGTTPDRKVTHPDVGN